jgi:hypothetical protein
MSVQLFGGKYDPMLRPSQTYQGQYDNIDQAKDVAEGRHFDWAEVFAVTDTGLVLLGGGSFSSYWGEMVWAFRGTEEKTT